MTRYEYKVVPAPQRGTKAKAAKTTEARFALTLVELMNELGREGWEYQRSDTLPCEERSGLTGRVTKFQNMLIFRRELTPQFRTTVVPGFVHAAPGVADAQGVPVPGEAAAQLIENRPGVPTHVTRRLAAALSAHAHEGKTPALSTEAAPGPTPKLGAAKGQGLAHPQGNGPGVAAE